MKLRWAYVLPGLPACAAGVIAGTLPPTAYEPITPPLYSIDRFSPTTGSGFRPGAVLVHPGPTVVIPAQNLSLFSPIDELNAISFNRNSIGPSTSLAVLFSVDRTSVGALPPDPLLVTFGFLYNVQNQATRGQEAGDVYMGLLQYTVDGPVVIASSYTNNNTLVRNQGDAGGVGMSLEPATSPDDPVPPPIDDVDAGAIPDETALAGGPPPKFYFCVRQGSPSLPNLPGNNSGADVYVDLNTGTPSGEIVYASFAALGLVAADEIDALIVIDYNNDQSFNPTTDQIIFSLARGSPSLEGRSPADLFTTINTFGDFALYSQAIDLGLQHNDNVDMLEFIECRDILECVQRWAIGINRRVIGDCNCDGVLNNFDIDAFVLALTDPAAYEATYPECNIFEADINGDGRVDNFDIDPFVNRLVNAP
ncbi:MAG: hypothetical protein JNG88_04595 [Phycisphaerales bacterium]|nr:hypothetical protein [Phycisphaerales bacterium]